MWVLRGALDLIECSAVAIVMKLLTIFEQGALYFHFALGHKLHSRSRLASEADEKTTNRVRLSKAKRLTGSEERGLCI